MQFAADEDERRLVQRCLAGDKRAWDHFFEIHYKTISSIVGWRKWGFEPTERDDVTQDILEGVIKSLSRFEFKARVSTFVYRICVSSCIAALRKKTVAKRRTDFGRPSNDDPDGDWEDKGDYGDGNSLKNPEKILIQRESISSVRKALARLGDPCKELIGFRYFEELSFAEISEMTGVKENTLVVRLKRCLARLLESIQGGNVP